MTDETPEADPAEAADRPATRMYPPRTGQRRVRRWSRHGKPTSFGTQPKDGSRGVGWTWEIGREGPEQRHVEVEVSPGPYRVTDLPAESRNAIRSRGATAVDAFLETDDPPVRIVVSTDGLHAQYLDRGNTG